MARQFRVLDWQDCNGISVTNIFEGFNQNFSLGELHTIENIALVKDEDNLLVFALDNTVALTALRSYLIEYHPKAIMFGYFTRPTLKVTNPLTNYRVKP